MNLPEITSIVPESLQDYEFDIGFWMPGYEARSRWLIESKYRPQNVKKWYKVLLNQTSNTLDLVHNESIRVGNVFGRERVDKNWDGYLTGLWRRTVVRHYRQHGRKIKIFLDYSSMPRTLYGTLLISALRELRKHVDCVTVAYVPGEYGIGIESSRRLLRLRPLIGTEGVSEDYRKSSAYIFGLGYDGLLAETIIDFYQISHYSCFYADPGVSTGSAIRCATLNENTLRGTERILTAPACSIKQTTMAIQELCEWYSNHRTVMLIPLGPKPHVLASILIAATNDRIAFRWVKSIDTPVQVTVPDNQVPCVSNIVVN